MTINTDEADRRPHRAEKSPHFQLFRMGDEVVVVADGTP